MNLANSDIISINPRWCLRNDKDYLVLYKYSTTESIALPLPPPIAIFVTLLNNGARVSTLIKEICYVFNIDSKTLAYKFIQNAIKQLNGNDSILLINSAQNEKLTFDENKYFIRPHDYNLPKNGRLNKPTHIRLSVGFSCETNCVYCYAERKQIPYSERLGLSRWIELIDEAIRNEIFNIEISGADPFADDLTIKLISYVLKANIPVFLSTKAMLKPDIIDKLIESGLNFEGYAGPSTLQISIDSTVPEIADYLSGVKEYIKRADDNIKLCLDKGIRTRIKCVLTRVNHNSIIPIIDKYYDLGVRFFQFVQCGYSHFRDINMLLLNSSQKNEIVLINDALNIDDYPGAEIIIQTEKGSANTPFSPESWANRSRCSGGYNSLTICPDGNVILCEQMPANEDFYVGNVKEKNIIDIWNSDKLVKWVQPHIDAFIGSPCYDCNEFEDCVHNAGWCYRDALFAYDNMYTAPPRCPRQSLMAKRLL